MKCFVSIIIGVLLLEISSADTVTPSTITALDNGGDQLVFAHVVSKKCYCNWTILNCSANKIIIVARKNHLFIRFFVMVLVTLRMANHIQMIRTKMNHSGPKDLDSLLKYKTKVQKAQKFHSKIHSIWNKLIFNE